MAFERGERLGGRYEIYAIAGDPGRSGMGTVYICYDHEHGSALALKTYHEDYFNDAKLLNHFKRGALAWIQLDRHPNIVQAHGVYDLAERLFLGLEYIAPDDEDRNTLSEHLQGSVSLESALKWGIQFCDGMEHARQRGITPHRDVKPDNLMVTRDGTLKVTDFDMAGLWNDVSPPHGAQEKDASHLSAMTFIKVGEGKHVVGTLPWMAPEQFDGTTTVQSDIYSFGVVLYQMAAHGHLPCRPQRDDDWCAAHKNTVPEPLPTPLWPIIERCLAKRPSERFGSDSAELGFAELRAALAGSWRQHVPNQALPEAPVGATLEAADHASKGASLAALGLHDQAMAEYKKAIALKPDYAPAYLNAGVSLANKGDKAKAAKALKKALQLDPGMGEAYHNFGLLAKDAGELDHAERAFRKALEVTPNLSIALRTLGVLLSEDGRHDEAIDLMDKAVERDPTNAGFHYSYGVSLEKSERFEESVDKFVEAVRLRPQDPLYQYGLGNAYRYMGDMNRAIACWKQAVALDPKHAISLFNLGVACEGAGDLLTAYHYHSQSISADPAHPNPCYNLGVILAKHGLYGEGADHFQQFLDNITPDLEEHAEKARGYIVKMRGDEAIMQKNMQYPEGVYNRGNAYLNLRRLDEAKQYFDRALELRPGYPSALTALGIYHERRGDWDESAACHQRAIDSDPDHALAWNNLGWVHYNTGNHAEGVKAYSRYIRIAPEEQAQWVADAKQRRAEMQQAGTTQADAQSQEESPYAQINDILGMFVEDRQDDGLSGLAAMAASANSAEAHITLGEEYASRGRHQEALDQYFKALEIEPENIMAFFHIGRAFIAEGDYDAAEGQFRDLMAQHPDQASFPYNLGESLRLRGSLEEAVTAYQDAIKLEPGLSSAHCNLGVALDGLERTKEAVSAYHAAIKCDPDNETAHFNLAQSMDKGGFGDLALASYREFIRCARPAHEQHVRHAEEAIARLDR